MPRHALIASINLCFTLMLISVVTDAAPNKEYWWMNDQSLFAPSNSLGSGSGSGGGSNWSNQGSGGSGGCGGNGGGCGGGNFQSHSSSGSIGGGGSHFNNGNNQHSSSGSSGHWNNNDNQGSSGNHRPVVDPQPLRTPAPRQKPSRNNGCGGGGYGGGGNCGNNLPAPSRPASGAPVVQTECPSGSKCVAEHFCDANGIMSNQRVSLTQYEKDQRGEMISCMMNQNTGSWGICCGIPSNNQPSRPSNNNFNNPNNNQNRQPSRPNNNNFNNQNRQPSRPNNNNFNNQNTAQQSCPNVNNLPPVEQCAGRSSNCWSVGQPDVDCPGNALCCFDGCANTCQGGGGGNEPRQPSQSNNGNSNVGQGSNQFSPAQSNNNQVSQSRPQNNPSINKPQKQTPIKSYPALPNQSDNLYPDIQQGSGVRPSQQARPQNRPKQNRPSQNTRPQKRPQQTRPQKRPQKPKPQRRPQQNQRPSNSNNRQQQGNNNNRGNNDPRLSVMCPSAMLCVPKPNCDFKGVITDIPLNNLSPEIEALRVPYLGCVNPQDPSDATTVCCRDPNYKDPWPNMNGNSGGGKNKNMTNRNNNNNNGGNNNNSKYSQNGNGIQPRNGNHG